MNTLLLKITNVKKQYNLAGGAVKEALRDVSLDIYAGEVLGLLGVNGAGKTTLSSIIATLHPPTAGDVLYNNSSIYNDINSYRRIIGYCPQYPNLINDLTVEQNLILAGQYFSMGYKAVCARVEELMERYELEAYRRYKPEDLSGGYRHRVLIARALIHNPKLLILDEPTVGLDPHVRHQLWEEISNLRAEGVTVLLTTHYLDEAEFLSDRICILDKGSIKLIGTPEELKTIYQKSRLEDVFLQLMHEDK
jgi:ABC-2 type transport system ATP-binding protein